MQNHNAGFTLLEVLIAVTILAVVAAGLIGVTTQSLRQSRMLEEKTIAMWVAENRIAELRAKRRWLQADNTKDIVHMANRSWNVQTTISHTDHLDMRRIDVTVFPSEVSEKHTPIASLTGFIGRH